MTDQTAAAGLAYIAPSGSGLGFRLSGINIVPADTADEMLASVKKLKEAGQHSIIFVDEGLAADVLTDIERLNADTIPAIVLLPNPANPRHLTQEAMNNLIVQAVGSDIFSN